MDPFNLHERIVGNAGGSFCSPNDRASTGRDNVAKQSSECSFSNDLCLLDVMQRFVVCLGK